jgi:hypothetical protein
MLLRNVSRFPPNYKNLEPRSTVQGYRSEKLKSNEVIPLLLFADTRIVWQKLRHVGRSTSGHRKQLHTATDFSIASWLTVWEKTHSPPLAVLQASC